MCKQGRSNCLNSLCNGFAQTLRLIPCEKKPNCETKATRIPAKLRSTESYCPDCRRVTRRQRKTIVLTAWRAARKKSAKAEALEGQTTDAGESGHAGAELQTESSRMGESRRAVGGGGMFLSLDDDSFLRSDQRPMEPVSDFDEPMADAPTNDEDPSTDSYPDATNVLHETNLGAVTRASNGVPHSVASYPFLARGSTTPRREHTPPSSMLTELTGWFNAELGATNTSNYATGPDAATALRDLLISPSISVDLSNQSGANLPDPGAWNMTLPQIPDHPSSPQNPVDPAPIHVHATFSDGENPIEDMRNDEEFLSDMDSSDESLDLSEIEGK